MRAISSAILLLLVWTSRVIAGGGSIGLYADPACTSCNLTIATGATARFYAIARSDAGQFGPYCAEFRVAGAPPGWEVVAVEPNPAAYFVLGNPLEMGARIAFSSGQLGGCVVLFAIDVRAETEASDVILRVMAHESPFNPDFACPNLCIDWPAFALICVDGGEIFVNSAATCAVGVAPASWSVVKSLYD